jgi:hypothetical protein
MDSTNEQFPVPHLIYGLRIGWFRQVPRLYVYRQGKGAKCVSVAQALRLLKSNGTCGSLHQYDEAITKMSAIE